MEASTVELKSVFQHDIRYLVPIYQRNYKWDEEKHWGPLWQDVCRVANDVLASDGHGDVDPHFLGAIVCEQVPVGGRDAKTLSVIDGQQRLTTLALLFGAAHAVCTARGFLKDASYLAPRVMNSDDVADNRLDHRYKVWPNPVDREAFVAAMQGKSGTTQPQRAYEYFKGQINQWLDIGQEDDPDDDLAYSPEKRMTALIDGLMTHVKIVQIDLHPRDNARLIFETLNARGERLTDADLIRNALFRQADQELKGRTSADGGDVMELYDTYWKPFDDKYWSENVAHGRHQRDRLSLYLNHWLSMKRRSEILAGALFVEFKEYVRQAQMPAVEVAKDVAGYASVFDSLSRFSRNSREWWFLRRLREMDLITVYPVLLFLFGLPATEFSEKRRARALDAIESFLVRRLIERASTRSYGSLFIEVLKTASEGAVSDADARIIKLLQSKTSEADRWPSDQSVRSTVHSSNIYKLKQSRLKMILEGIDVYRSSNGNTEHITLGHNLWIEHLLPQSWRDVAEWRLPQECADPTQAGLDRDRMLHTLGNLTLTTAKLDIRLSNRPWSEKLDQLRRHAALQLNRDLVAAAPATWAEEQIVQRSAELADDVIRIWPSGDTLLQKQG